MSKNHLSKKGQKLIELYKEMATSGYSRTDGSQVYNAYNDFELRKFREICKEKLAHKTIKTILDYGGGGSDWDTPGFDPKTGFSAKKFFQLKKVTNFEPARDMMHKEVSDCVVCMDVLEHIFLTDIPYLIHDLFSLARKLVVINVACYKAAACLPNGENAHITIRSPEWWKGVIDIISMDYAEVEVILICSNSYNTGIYYESFKSKDWDQSKEFAISHTGRTFGIN